MLCYVIINSYYITHKIHVFKGRENSSNDKDAELSSSRENKFYILKNRARRSGLFH